LFPPLIFNFLVKNRKGYRLRPVSLVPLLRMAWAATVFFMQLATVYVYGFLLFVVTKKNENKTLCFRRYIRRLYAYDLKHIPGVKFNINNPSGDEIFTEPKVVVCNHQSMLDAAVFMALNEKLILVSNGNPSSNLFVRRIFRWMEFISLDDIALQDVSIFHKYRDKGYSFVVFPEGERNDSSSILRFHKGAFYLAENLDIDILPVLIHGFNHVLPRNSLCVYSGELSVFVRPVIHRREMEWGKDYVELTKAVHEYYVDEYFNIKKRIETADYYAPIVKDRYRYKGVDIFASVVRNLKKTGNYAMQINSFASLDIIRLNDDGYGELALLCALVYPKAKVQVVMHDEEKADVLRYSADKLVGNIEILKDEKIEILKD